jgi:hypothetical protein
MVGYLKYSENSEDRELALQKPKKEMGGPLWQRCPRPRPVGVAHRRAGVGHDEMRDDHMTVAKTQTLSG